MEESGDSGGTISGDQLDALVRLFDRFEYAQDPNSTDAKEAESDWNSLIDVLFTKATARFPNMTRGEFLVLVRRQCQKVIVKGNRKPPSIPPSA